MFNATERLIADHFEITIEELLTNKNRNSSDARHFLWYILHAVFGYSSNTIARRYHVSARNILYYSASIREGIKHQPYFSSHFQRIQDELKSLDTI